LVCEIGILIVVQGTRGLELIIIVES